MQDTPWSELFKPTLLGLLGASPAISSGVRSAKSEVVIELDRPAGCFVKVAHRLVDDTDLNQYLIDADFFVSERKETDAVFAILDDFNRQARNLWRWAIQDRLSAKLGSKSDATDGVAAG